MRLRQLKYKVAGAAAALSLVAGIGVVFAGPAFAKDNIRMCVFYPSTGSEYCAITGDTLKGTVYMGPGPSGEQWNAPTSGQGQISYAGSPKYCMSINASRSDDIYQLACAGHSYQEWQVIGGSESLGGGVTVPTYIYQRVYDSKVCLSAPSASQAFGGDLYALSCNFKDPRQNWLLCSGVGCGANS